MQKTSYSDASIVVRVARAAGACYGVERALSLVKAAAQEHTDIYTLGPLIHNPRVVSELEEIGVHSIDKPEPKHDGVLVLRTHGVTPELEHYARKHYHQVIDATCPFVKRTHNEVKRLYEQGYQVVVVGDKGHPEVEATQAQVPHTLRFASTEEVRASKISGKVGVVVQTTFSETTLDEIVAELETMVDELVVVNTICEATSSHQSSAEELASQSDVMIVIGGRNSANTRRLTEICSEAGARTYHIESEAELEPAWFKGVQSIGISAGASTPSEHIEATKRQLQEILVVPLRFE